MQCCWVSRWFIGIVLGEARPLIALLGCKCVNLPVAVLEAAKLYEIGLGRFLDLV